VTTGEERTNLQGDLTDFRAVALTPDGRLLAALHNNLQVKVWDVSTGAVRASFVAGTDRATTSRAVAFSPEGKLLAVAAEGREKPTSVRVWDLETNQECRVLGRAFDNVNALAFGPGGRTLATTSTGVASFPRLELWDVATGRSKNFSVGIAASALEALTFSPDGQTLAVGWGKLVKLWDVPTGQERTALGGHSRTIKSLAFSPDGATLASGADDGEVRLWDVRGGQERALIEGLGPSISALTFVGRSCEALVAVNVPGKLCRWDLGAARDRALLRGHTDFVNAAVFSPNGAILATTGADRTVKLWDTRTGEERMTLKGFVDEYHSSIAFVRHELRGDLSACAAFIKAVLTPHPAIHGMAFSPDGRWLALFGGANQSREAGKQEERTRDRVKVWEVATGKEELILTDVPGPVTAVAIGPAGDVVATGGKDGLVHLWDFTSGKARGNPLNGHASPITALVFSPEGTHLNSYEEKDDPIRWNLVNRQQLPEVPPPLPPRGGGVISSDGRLQAFPRGSVVLLRER
jgi:WD40 repeat protein